MVLNDFLAGAAGLLVGAGNMVLYLAWGLERSLARKRMRPVVIALVVNNIAVAVLITACVMRQP